MANERAHDHDGAIELITKWQEELTLTDLRLGIEKRDDDAWQAGYEKAIAGVLHILAHPEAVSAKSQVCPVCGKTRVELVRHVTRQHRAPASAES